MTMFQSTGQQTPSQMMNFNNHCSPSLVLQAQCRKWQMPCRPKLQHVRGPALQTSSPEKLQSETLTLPKGVLGDTGGGNASWSKCHGGVWLKAQKIGAGGSSLRLITQISWRAGTFGGIRLWYCGAWLVSHSSVEQISDFPGLRSPLGLRQTPGLELGSGSCTQCLSAHHTDCWQKTQNSRSNSSRSS